MRFVSAVPATVPRSTIHPYRASRFRGTTLREFDHIASESVSDHLHHFTMASAAERLSDGASEEKKIGNEHLESERHTIENLPDPDEGLSDEERAAHVRTQCQLLHYYRTRSCLTRRRTASSSGNSTANSYRGSLSCISSLSLTARTSATRKWMACKRI